MKEESEADGDSDCVWFVVEGISRDMYAVLVVVGKKIGGKRFKVAGM